jgi:hypothetical protein
MTRGHRGSLLLRCRASSSPSPCRFYPGALTIRSTAEISHAPALPGWRTGGPDRLKRSSVALQGAAEGSGMRMPARLMVTTSLAGFGERLRPLHPCVGSVRASFLLPPQSSEAEGCNQSRRAGDRLRTRSVPMAARIVFPNCGLEWPRCGRKRVGQTQATGVDLNDPAARR